MPSKILTGAVVFNLAGLIVLMLLHFYDKDKVVFIDSTKVINGYHGMAEARKEYQSKMAVWKANLDTLSLEIQQDILAFEKESAKLTTREKDLTQQLIQNKKKQLDDYHKAISEKAGHEDAVATKKVIDEINAYIKKYGEDHNYTIVLAATEYGNIAYAKEYLDITQAVIEGLNNQYGVTSNKK